MRFVREHHSPRVLLRVRCRAAPSDAPDGRSNRLRPRASTLVDAVKALEKIVFGPCTLGRGAPVPNQGPWLGDQLRPIRHDEAALFVKSVVTRADENWERKPQISPLRYAPPDFLYNFVALTDLMRLSLRERRTRDLVQCSVAGNPGRDDKGKGNVR